MERLLALGASPFARSKYGNTPFWWAAQKGSVEVMRALLVVGVDINAAAEGGETPLISLAMFNEPGATERLALLLEQPGLDLAATHEDLTAEQWARKHGHIHLADMIRERAAY